MPVRVRLADKDAKAAHEAITKLGGTAFGRVSSQTLRPTVSRLYRFPVDILESLARVEGVLWIGP